MRISLPILSSIRLTVTLLFLAVALVFFATLDQVHIGIRGAQDKYFESFLAWWQYPEPFWLGPQLRWLHLPIPGGYLVGPLLILNLFAAHLRYFKWSWQKVGITFIHTGVLALIVGQGLTDLLQEEDKMHIFEGSSSNYLESFYDTELAVIDRSHPEKDLVVSIPTDLLKGAAPDSPRTFSHPDLPFSLRVTQFFPNARFIDAEPGSATRGIQVNQGLAPQMLLHAEETGETFAMDDVNLTTAFVELTDPSGTSLGSWMASSLFMLNFYPAQEVQYGDKTFEIALRPTRTYLPYEFSLTKVTHDKYPGTEIPRNFASDIVIRNPEANEVRSAKVYMNHPLRYGGKAYFQYQMSAEQIRGLPPHTVFQVVDNPGWTVPYIACVLVAVGLVVQFTFHLLRFASKRAGAKEKRTSTVTPWDLALLCAAGASLLFCVLLGYNLWLLLLFFAIILKFVVQLVATIVRMRGRTAGPTEPSVRRAALVALVVGLGVLAYGFRPVGYQTEFDAASFGRLPVLEGGRLKPMDTVARNSMLNMREKQSVADENGERAPALEWLMAVFMDPAKSKEFRSFRIVNDELLALVGRKQEKRKDFSFSELQPHLETIEEEARRTEAVEHAYRTPYENAVLKLHSSLGLFLAFTYSLHNPSIAGPVDEVYNAYLESIPAAIESVHASGTDPAADNPALNRFAGFARAFQLLNRSPLRPVPPASPQEGLEGWRTVGVSLAGETLVDAIQTKEIDPAVRGYGRLIDAYQAGDSQTFNQEVQSLLSLAEKRSGSGAKLHFETFFNQYQPFYLSMILYVLAFLGAAASWLFWGKPLARAAFWLLVFAFLVHNYGLIARMIIQGRPPVTNLYSSAVFIGWVSVILGILLEYIHRNGIGSVVAALIGFSTLVIAHNLAILEQGDTMGPPRAVLDSNFWLSIHVITVTIGYAATFVAGILALVFLARGLFTGAIDERLTRVFSGMVYGIVCFALLFSFVGTVTGGIWADQSWGRFWGWDPKENGALMIVLWNALILHARWGGVVRTRGFMCLAVAGNIITSWSWFGTNMLGVGLHSYGFMDSAFIVLVSVIAFHLVCIAVAMLIPRRFWASPAAVGLGPAAAPPAGPAPAGG